MLKVKKSKSKRWWTLRRFTHLPPPSCAARNKSGRHDLQAAEKLDCERVLGRARVQACPERSRRVPISPLILSFRGGFSRRGVCFSEFFRSLLDVLSATVAAQQPADGSDSEA